MRNMCITPLLKLICGGKPSRPSADHNNWNSTFIQIIFFHNQTPKLGYMRIL